MSVTYSHPIKELLKEIDVSEYDYEKAIKRYESISAFVEDSMLNQFNPYIFIQGSFKLGTAIKPIIDNGSYDIDMVMNLRSLSKRDLSQNDLKLIVGKVVKDYTSANGMTNAPKSGKRCWTIEYVDQHNFHVDILPTINDSLLDDHKLAFTNRNNPNYNDVSDFWDITNPKGYYEWFIKNSNYSLFEKRYARDFNMQVENVPYYKVKTDLQRIVQILKRHAEVMFEDNKYKPSSIIITTLCTKAYSKIDVTEIRFENLLKIIVSGLFDELDYKNNRYCVLNPVALEEDLSYKWENPKYFEAFQKWINQLKFDMSVDYSSRKSTAEINLLKRSLFKSKNETELQNNIDLLPYHQKMQWNNRIWKDDVKIRAFICNDDNQKICEIKSDEPLEKGLNLRFEVNSNNINLYNIFWQITNTGYEANKANQLRGDFYNTETESRKWNENTLYSGRHYVEAFLVKKDGHDCVGRSAPFVVNVI